MTHYREPHAAFSRILLQTLDPSEYSMRLWTRCYSKHLLLHKFQVQLFERKMSTGIIVLFITAERIWFNRTVRRRSAAVEEAENDANEHKVIVQCLLAFHGFSGPRRYHWDRRGIVRGWAVSWTLFGATLSPNVLRLVSTNCRHVLRFAPHNRFQASITYT